MRKPEQNLWQRIKAHKPRGAWLQRVENAVQFGMPDIYCVIREADTFWLETKVLDMPVRDTSFPFSRGDLRLKQVNWHIKAHSYGLPSFIAAQIGDQLFLIPGSVAPNITSITKQEMLDEYLCDSWEAFWKRLS